MVLELVYLCLLNSGSPLWIGLFDKVFEIQSAVFLIHQNWALCLLVFWAKYVLICFFKCCFSSYEYEPSECLFFSVHYLRRRLAHWVLDCVVFLSNWCFHQTFLSGVWKLNQYHLWYVTCSITDFLVQNYVTTSCFKHVICSFMLLILAQEKPFCGHHVIQRWFHAVSYETAKSSRWHRISGSFLY